MKIKHLKQIWIWLLFLMASSLAFAENNWRAKAVMDISSPGIIEAVMPPELVNRTVSGPMSLRLTGPDGNTRGFELYWREPVDDTSIYLSPVQVALDDVKGFIWEAVIPERMVVRQLIVELAGQNYIGKIDVYGYRQEQWIPLVKNAAVFSTDGTLRGRIDLPKAEYQRLRLCLTGFDHQAKQKLSPIKIVIAKGERIGKNFAGQVLSLPFHRSETQKEIVVDAAMPGSGLWVRTLTLKTEAQFQGSWKIGTETISDGHKKFVVIKSGQISHVNRQYQVLEIDMDTQWPGSSLVLKLDTNQHYIGAVTGLDADVRLPRLVFSADKPGNYTLFSGIGNKQHVLKQPGDALRKPDSELIISNAQTNPLWQPASLVDRYKLKGASFDAAGSKWRAPVTITKPGYYKLALSLSSILKSKTRSIRIVNNNLQVPFIQGRIENKKIKIPVEEIYDAKKNQSQWIIKLPGPSDKWQNLTLHADGIFKRKIQLQHPKPGNMGWQPWRTLVWENRKLKETALQISLRSLPPEIGQIRIVISNGDNQPIKISKITARYATPTFYFLAHQAGLYFVYGGNLQAVQPNYDLSLVQNELLAALPENIEMGELESFQQPGWKDRISTAFTDTGWGLYGVLALVTLVLIGIIVKLFPKGEEKSNRGS